jgi:hypothetical protein
MSWIKYLVILIIVSLFSIVTVYFTDLVAKKFLGLGQPVVYDAHPLWGYSPRENRKYTRFNGDTVTINEVGTRSINPWNANGNNIVFIGDSITYGGSYINDDQTFASLSCTELSNWTCHNAGVNAYGILNMVARSRYDTRISSARIRVFTFITEDFDRGLQDANTAHFVLRESPQFLSALWEISNFLAAKIIPKNWFGKSSDIQDQKRLEREVALNRQFALDIMMSELRRLEHQGLDFLLVYSPNVTEIRNREMIKNNTILIKLQKEYPNRYLNLIEAVGDNYLRGDDLIFYDQTHYEQEGHRLISNYLFPRLRELTIK